MTRPPAPHRALPAAPDDTAQDMVLRRRVRVEAIGDGQAEVSVDRASGCTACAARAGCGAAALGEMTQARDRLRLEACGTVQPGDEVIVAMDGRALLGVALRAYLLPAAALAGTAASASALGMSDAATAALCLPALVLSLWPLLRADRRARDSDTLWLEAAPEAADAPK